MSISADKVVITIDGSGYTIEAKFGRNTLVEQRSEIIDDGVAFERSGDDLFEQLCPELAASLDAMDLMLMDAAIALIPSAKATDAP